jgi:hypothetical protein
MCIIAASGNAEVVIMADHFDKKKPPLCFEV